MNKTFCGDLAHRDFSTDTSADDEPFEFTRGMQGFGTMPS
jgi:hypothetical protein